MIDLHNKNFCYFVMVTAKNNQGFIPCIAIENEPGYHLTDWNWGKDFELAQECAQDKNDLLGITEEEAFKLVASTM